MGCGAAEATDLGFVCFVVIVGFVILFQTFSNFTLLSDIENLSEFSVEYLTALVMNLSLRSNGAGKSKDKQSTINWNVIRL